MGGGISTGGYFHKYRDAELAFVNLYVHQYLKSSTKFLPEYPVISGASDWAHLPSVSRNQAWHGQGIFLSNENYPGWLGYVGDYTTQLYGDFNKPI